MFPLSIDNTETGDSSGYLDFQIISKNLPKNLIKVRTSLTLTKYGDTVTYDLYCLA